MSCVLVSEESEEEGLGGLDGYLVFDALDLGHLVM